MCIDIQLYKQTSISQITIITLPPFFFSTSLFYKLFKSPNQGEVQATLTTVKNIRTSPIPKLKWSIFKILGDVGDALSFFDLTDYLSSGGY